VFIFKGSAMTVVHTSRLYHWRINCGFQDYMDNVRGKEVSLLRTTVKIPGQRPRGSEATKPTQQSNGQQPANQRESHFVRYGHLLSFLQV